MPIQRHKSEGLHLIKQMRKQAVGFSVRTAQSIIFLHCHVYVGDGINKLNKPWPRATPFPPVTIWSNPQLPVLDDTEFISAPKSHQFISSFNYAVVWQNSGTGSVLQTDLGRIFTINKVTNKFIEAAESLPRGMIRKLQTFAALQTNNSKVRWAEQGKGIQ